MVDFRAFETADVERFDCRMAELAGLDDWRGMILKAAGAGPAWTGWHAARPLGCGGLALAWRGRAQAWCVLAPDIPRTAWPAIHRAVARRLAQAAEVFELRRIEAEAMFGYPPAARWLRLLGFEAEGVMRNYGPHGEDFLRFARVPSDPRAPDGATDQGTA
jgi:hypothetical protein